MLLCGTQPRMRFTDLVVLTWTLSLFNEEAYGGCVVVYEPLRMTDLTEGTSRNLFLNLTCSTTFDISDDYENKYNFKTEDTVTDLDGSVNLHVRITSRNDVIAVVKDADSIVLSDTEPSANVTVVGRRLGRTTLNIERIGDTIKHENISLPSSYTVLVVRKRGAIDIIFAVVLGTMILVQNFGFGCKIQLNAIKEILRRPVAPAIGFCCQFLCMAPLSVGISQLLRLDNVMSIGLLAIGSSAGGGASNIFAFLLDADLDLSIAMTFISTVGALGMTPFWMWVFSRLYVADVRVHIPIVNVLASVAVVVLPVAVGVIVNHFKPNVGAIIVKLVRPWIALIAIAFATLVPLAFHYIFTLVTWQIFLACFLTPVLGSIIGATVAAIFKQELPKITTISLETGMQNLQLALVMIGISLSQPESDMATTMPMMYTLVGIIPWVIIGAVKIVWNCVRKRLLLKGDAYDLDAMVKQDIEYIKNKSKDDSLGTVIPGEYLHTR
ncbi:unnamed protein product [Owenia fusiformis]|uniref:Uncharacterized protein n=1 Tax=Owenia fusiformis TaxID=6347 RepID=A0A8J1YAI5_OWEFU|nr:unnamed protein product [Owenia fusiformis]